ncbi:hypothetical protein OIO90_004332 [Microbotryomycetes sp. JL221]|nr:hypothetical protein OIO90_004332 [Microbotryomycetes sp. JL221]
MLPFPLLTIVLSSLMMTKSVSSQRIDSPPSVVSCLNTRLSFGGGTPPYYISVVPAGDVGAAPLVTLPPQIGTSYTWPVELPAGSNITFVIRDSEGILNFSSPVTVQQGPEGDDCSFTSSSTSPSSSESMTSSSTFTSSPLSSSSSTRSSDSETESSSSTTSARSSSVSSATLSTRSMTSSSFETKEPRSTIPAASAQVTSDNSGSGSGTLKIRFLETLIVGLAIAIAV